MKMLLWGLQSPINIGMILRTAEIYHVPTMIYDPHGVLEQQSARVTIADFACGAFERAPPWVLTDAPALTVPEGRLIAATLDNAATPIDEAALDHADCVLIGNEYDGLPDEALAICQQRIRIPMPAGAYPKPRSTHPIDPSRSKNVKNDGDPSLNVAVAASIIIFCAARVGRTSTEVKAGSPLGAKD